MQAVKMFLLGLAGMNCNKVHLWVSLSSSLATLHLPPKEKVVVVGKEHGERQQRRRGLQLRLRQLGLLDLAH